MSPLDPDVTDLAPTGPALTAYDEEHAVTYVRMLDADREGADWREVSRIALHIDPEREPDRARRAFDSPSRASQMGGTGRIPATAPRWGPSHLTRAALTAAKRD
jgi:hypothetical protein